MTGNVVGSSLIGKAKVHEIIFDSCYLEMTLTFALSSIKGKNGVRGLEGASGNAGALGLPGAQGQKGEKGVPGALAKRGKPGAMGAKGHDGPKGAPGEIAVSAPMPKGARGEDGDEGQPGLVGNTGEMINFMIIFPFSLPSSIIYIDNFSDIFSLLF